MKKILIMALACGMSSASMALNFNISSTGNSNFDAGFQMAAARWSALFSDNITVNIHAGAFNQNSAVLGQTSSSRQGNSYSSLRAALSADATSADDATAVANLDAGSSISYYSNYTNDNPNGSGSSTPFLTSSSTVVTTTANAKALGIFSGNANDDDASISFNEHFSFDFDPSDGISGGAIDFVGVATHEIGHALGFISQVDSLDYYTNNYSSAQYALTSLDMFRYSNVGGGNNRVMMAGPTDSFFSIDGGSTLGAQFSEGISHGDGRQASHWKDNLGLGIMDPTTGYGELDLISNNDIRAFDSIGYNLSSVPEPTTMVMLGLGLAGLAARKRRKA